MKNLYLHIGHEKTGTTALQIFFSQNQDYLKSEGVLYPVAGQAGIGGHIGLVNPLFYNETNKHLEFFKGAENYGMDQWDFLVDEIESYIGDTIVISAELFSSRLSEPSIKYIYDRLSNIKNTKTTIVFYARRHDELLESYFSTLVKNGSPRTLESLYQAAIKREKYFDYVKILNPWINQFGSESIILRLYDNKLLGNNIIIDFLHAIGKSGIAIDSSKYGKENTSLQPATAYLCSLVNRKIIGLGYFERTKKVSVLLRQIQNMFSDNAQHNEYSLLTDTQKKQLIAEYEQETRQLFTSLKADRYFPDITTTKSSVVNIHDVDWTPHLSELVSRLIE